MPDGKRVAVWVLVSIEEWDINSPMPRTVNTPPAGGVPTPDIPNWIRHEYGNRVGFWRLAETSTNRHQVGIMSDEDIKSRATWAGRIRERMWDYLTDGDPERG